MATTHTNRRQDFWSLKPPDMYVGAAFRLNGYMTKTRFEQILGTLQFTDQQPLQHTDKFWEVRQLIDAWNANMHSNFSPS